ncbi:expressed unknown protein [Seminavis robusta]|uniref:Uncharacterized protein n=1 Tax=Seminavis robusta TaxID=568900 RepID=A0A9N8D9X9_9STRA|nr:expressed unknown protein [Seminavis robusta]|eukprot:Sro57_g033460.1 n/a (298) ;mRNA; r:110474-111590
MMTVLPTLLLPLLLVLVLLASPGQGYRKVGWPCRAIFQCESEYCNSTLQCDTKRAVGQTCEFHDACASGRCSGGVCQVPQPAGGPCAVHEDCDEGYCGESSTCLAWKDREIDCLGDHECRSGRCTRNPLKCTFTVKDGEICGKDNDCEMKRCKKDRGLNRCYDRKWNEHFCNDNTDCWSLRCEGVAPARNCTEPEWLGKPCDEASDCYSLFCNKEQGICVASAADAGSDYEVIEDAPGVVGSATVDAVNNGGGSVDISAGGSGSEVFEANAQSSAAWAVSVESVMLVGCTALLAFLY